VTTIAEIPYPRIDPILVRIGDVPIRWYGLSYILAFVLAFLVLRTLSRRGRWPVPPDRVADVLFWGILGVFLGGRLGWILFYAIESGGFDWSHAYRVWEGGMSFHGGLLGVVVAYWIYTGRKRVPRGDFFDGLSLATPFGIFCVRMANFVNAELYGREWDGPWAMRFPRYPQGKPELWDGSHVTEPRHPSQVYEALIEGPILFAVLWWLGTRRGVGGGRISGWFLVLYGAGRFLVEFTREPDEGLGFVMLGFLSRGQQLCLAMIVAGLAVLWTCARRSRAPASPA
jgi:phosphatidylglycerol:prolipoprotein diacylglycerol transferase